MWNDINKCITLAEKKKPFSSQKTNHSGKKVYSKPFRKQIWLKALFYKRLYAAGVRFGVFLENAVLL